MTFASAFGLVLLMLFGTAIIVGALNTRRLVLWENRVLDSLADTARDYRVSLEGERQQPVARVRRSPAPRRRHSGDRAA